VPAGKVLGRVPGYDHGPGWHLAAVLDRLVPGDVDDGDGGVDDGVRTQHGAFADASAFDHDGARADEGVVLDDDRPCAGGLEHPADADPASQVHAPADLGTGADGGPGVDHRVGTDVALLDLLARHRPDDEVLSEEAGALGAARRRWILDPIDGTEGFLAGAPVWGNHLPADQYAGAPRSSRHQPRSPRGESGLPSVQSRAVHDPEGDVDVDVLTEIEIARPRDAVASFATDPDNATSWYRNIRSVEWQTQPPLEVGTRVAFVAQFLGRRLAYTYEVREHAPGERLVMRTTDGPFAMETTYTWQDTGDGGTLMTLRNRGTPSGFAAVTAPAMTAAMRRANRKDLDQLRRIIESRPR
jgi:uncharacterized protein YndB with AHSA1/START domain